MMHNALVNGNAVCAFKSTTSNFPPDHLFGGNPPLELLPFLPSTQVLNLEAGKL